MKTYKEVNGTSYTEGTPKEVIEVFENARNSKTRLKVYFGDTETGKNWNEEHDTIGYVGRSAGSVKIPLLVYNSRSYGGGALLTDCILKIRTTKGEVLYTHPKFKNPSIEIVPSDMKEYLYNTIVDGNLYGRHKTLKSAENLKKKLA
jgi:hypothetical protein